MIPQKSRHESDCMAVCLASILEIPIEEIPDFFNDHKDAVSWYVGIQKWLNERGYHLFYASCAPIQFAEFQKSKSEPDESWPPKGYWLGRIARVETIVENGVFHSVVMKDHRCVYSPNSTFKALKENDVFLLGYYLLVPLDPVKFLYKEG